MCALEAHLAKNLPHPLTIPCAIPLYSHHPLPSTATHTYELPPVSA